MVIIVGKFRGLKITSKDLRYSTLPTVYGFVFKNLQTSKRYQQRKIGRFVVGC